MADAADFARRIRTSTFAGRCLRWPSTCARCWRSSRRAPSRSTTATTSAPRRATPAWPMPSTFPASCPRSSGRCLPRARARSAGPRCPATRRTSAGPTRRFCGSSPRTKGSAAGSGWRRRRCRSRGCPARICWLGYGERARAGLAFNELVRSGEVSAPIVIGRDHLDSGSVASPNRETEAMLDGSDAIADWPLSHCNSGRPFTAASAEGGLACGANEDCDVAEDDARAALDVRHAMRQCFDAATSWTRDPRPGFGLAHARSKPLRSTAAVDAVVRAERR